ncbi:cobalamin-dependent protein [Halothermothrix orenii]|uniref:Helix-turn-helix domain protein n=1 Tax=Halothermothrix orenii (strain H 168 / OCM 544 / DSM 9562) TaxID=373903 RepID=B8CW36_HALOH|nr:cobalamin-dependent protein [Halothermothrix orenii]ACL69505.1 helix-turn-helix domain protein [Halothermothrix orenii H 168]
MDTFASRLRSLRKEKKLRQKDLAGALGVAQTTIANYEQNLRFPNQDILNKLADYFNVSIDYLLGRSCLRQPTNFTSFKNNHITGENINYSKIIDSYINYILNGNQESARNLISKTVVQGATIKDIYLKVLEKALKKIGYLWELNKIDISDERLASMTTLQIMSQLMCMCSPGGKLKYKALCLSAYGESHTIGIKMISDLLYIKGFDVFYLGGNLPTSSVIKAIDSFRIDLLMISATMNNVSESVKNLVNAVRTHSSLKHIKIMVGGQLFNNNKSLLKELKIDGYAENADIAVKTAISLLNK